MRPDGSGERNLLSGHPLTETDPSWTPDERIVVNRGAKSPRGRGIDSVRADGRGLRRLHGAGGEPVVSPDGRLISFVWMPDDANEALHDAQQRHGRPADHGRRTADRMEPRMAASTLGRRNRDRARAGALRIDDEAVCARGGERRRERSAVRAGQA